MYHWQIAALFFLSVTYPQSLLNKLVCTCSIRRTSCKKYYLPTLLEAMRSTLVFVGAHCSVLSFNVFFVFRSIFVHGIVGIFLTYEFDYRFDKFWFFFLYFGEETNCVSVFRCKKYRSWK